MRFLTFSKGLLALLSVAAVCAAVPSTAQAATATISNFRAQKQYQTNPGSTYKAWMGNIVFYSYNASWSSQDMWCEMNINRYDNEVLGTNIKNIYSSASPVSDTGYVADAPYNEYRLELWIGGYDIVMDEYYTAPDFPMIETVMTSDT